MCKNYSIDYRIYFRVLILFLLACFLLTPAYANDITQGLKYYKKEEYQKAYRYFSTPAAQKNPRVQRILGYMYLKGLAVKQDYQKAMFWYGKSADQGNPKAMYDIGVMYDFGQGVKQDYKKASQYYRKAALLGYDDAQYNLGVLF